MTTKYLPQYIQPSNERRLFDLLEDLTPGQFRHLLNVSRQDATTSPTVITWENKQLDDLYFILDDNLSIEEVGRRLN